MECLYVNVVKGEDLVAKDLGGTSDPYCVLRTIVAGDMRNNKVKTSVIKKSLNPVWMEEFALMLPSDNDDVQLSLHVFDKDLMSKDDAMGSAQVSIPARGDGALHDVHVSLQAVKRGSVTLQLQRMNVDTYAHLFGAGAGGAPQQQQQHDDDDDAAAVALPAQRVELEATEVIRGSQALLGSVVWCSRSAIPAGSELPVTLHDSVRSEVCAVVHSNAPVTSRKERLKRQRNNLFGEPMGTRHINNTTSTYKYDAVVRVADNLPPGVHRFPLKLVVPSNAALTSASNLNVMHLVSVGGASSSSTPFFVLGSIIEEDLETKRAPEQKFKSTYGWMTAEVASEAPHLPGSDLQIRIAELEVEQQNRPDLMPASIHCQLELRTAQKATSNARVGKPGDRLHSKKIGTQQSFGTVVLTSTVVKAPTGSKLSAPLTFSIGIPGDVPPTCISGNYNCRYYVVVKVPDYREDSGNEKPFCRNQVPVSISNVSAADASAAGSSDSLVPGITLLR